MRRGQQAPQRKVETVKTRLAKTVQANTTWALCPNGPTFVEVAEARETVDSLCLDPAWADLFSASRVREIGFHDHAILTWASWIADANGLCVLRSIRLLLLARDGEHMARLVEGGAA